MGSLVALPAQRVTHFAQARESRRAPVDRAAPVERLILRVALAKTVRDLGLHQLGAEIESVRSIPLDGEFREQRERILADVMAVAIVNMDSVLGRFDQVVAV